MSRLTYWFERYLLLSWCVIGACSLVVLYWALERDPPFKLKEYTVSPATRGEAAYIHASVERDVSRDCSVTYVRYLLDKNKIRHDLGGPQYMPAAALAKVEQDTPSTLSVAVRIPSDIPVGYATLVTVSEYRCNPIHLWFPIEVVTELHLKILP